MVLTKIQEKTIIDILKKYNKGKILVNFKAPTGCGKTFMICNLISRIIQENINQGFNSCFICATISDGALPQQMNDNFNDYQVFLPLDKGPTFTTEYHQSPSSNDNQSKRNEGNICIEPIKDGVLIFGKSSFGKKRIFNEENVIGKLLSDIKNKNWKLIYIRDEAHLGGESLPKETEESKHFETLMKNNADFILKMTATPRDNEELTEISEKDLKNPDDHKYLIKIEPAIDKGIDSEEELDDFDYFKKAIHYFNYVIKLAYDNDTLLKNIRPAVLIQVDNEPTDEAKKKDWKDTLLKVENYLKVIGLSFTEYFAEKGKEQGEGRYSSLKESNNPKDLAKNDSLYDCIIFKVALAKGWNIPRATMIIQLRNLTSSALNIQTLGRIKRNPISTLEYNKQALTYYIYSKVNKTKENIHKFILDDQFKDKKVFPQVKKEYLYEAKQLNEKSFKKKIEKILNTYTNKINDTYIDNFKGKKQINIVVEKTDSHTRIYPILTCFQLKEFVNALISKNQKIFNLIYDTVNKTYRQYNYEFSLVHYLFIILNKECGIWEKIENEYKNCIDKQLSLSTYKYSAVQLPSFYEVLKDEDDKDDMYVEIQDFSQLLYHPYSDADERLFVDSEPEKKFFKEFRKTLKNLNPKEKSKIFIWGKNPSKINNNEVYLQYYDENDGNIYSAYLDVIIKYENKFLLVEIKSKNDIDADKTRMIEQSMNECFNDINNEDIYFCVARIDENNIQIENVYCKNNEHKELLKNRNLSGILDEIIKF